MLKGLTKAGLGAVESDKQLIELAAAGGFRAVDTDAKGLIEQYGEDGAKRLLEQNGLVLGAIGLSVEWRSDEETFLAGLPALAEEAAAAKKLGCTRCCTYILPSTDLKASHFALLATRRLRTCAQILGAYGIRLGLEFVGPHHLRTAWKHPFIWTLDETLDWIDTIGEPNVGLLFDSYHWYTNGHAIADIERLQPHQIVHVHLNDAPDVPVKDVLDNGRLYPGEGVIDLPGFLSALKRIGYNGVVSQEILTSSAPEETPEQLLRRSQQGFTRVFTAAGLEE
ncbi:sugar phosphate isomerase/epimerase family protein [Saccharibacillus sp. CPCC 101409]|uniref:sugar phosphate isomerase/epimerase family protein n=1 Tax=Saccharibacillus sp. CPCC 101409 TaxID=3058041 RepID=UPI00267283F8|nr:sugar phosphate isomerase/epimerase family protein [Saccharibacillus sp. CPCC 101409]MDO3411784.1 sugar phosphate isomerase/epimerase family protein [Saccharibacillus sp. CPCC 101409]